MAIDVGALANLQSPSDLDSVLIDCLPVAVCVCEAPSGRIVRFNRKAAELWGREPQVGGTAEFYCGSHRIYRPDGQALARDSCPMAAALQQQQAITDQEAVFERPDGTRVHVVTSVSLLRDQACRVLGAVSVFQDVTGKQTELQARQTEARFRQFLSALPAAAYMCDADGLITFFNERAVELWGRAPRAHEPADRYCGSFRLRRADGEPISQADCWMGLALRNWRAYEGEEIIIEREDGTQRHVLAYTSPFFGGEGELQGAVNLLVDITAQKHIEYSLREQQHHLQAIIEATPQCVKLVGRDGTLEQMNTAGLAMVEAERHEDVVGKPVFELIVPEDRARFRAAHERVCRGQRAVFQFDVHGLKGTRRTMETHAVPMPVRGGGYKHLAITGDISERRRAEALLQRQKQVLEMIAQGEPLAQILEVLCRVVEEQAEREVRAAISLLDPSGKRLRHGAAPGLPEEHNRAVDGMVVGPHIGTCAAAAATGEMVVTPDLETAPSWEGFRHLPLRLNLLAAWSMPILSSGGRVLGTFGTYFCEKREPTPIEVRLVEILSRTAALAIERKNFEQSLQDRALEMADADRRKDEFLATLAHELRNPLAPVGNALQVLRLTRDLPENVVQLREIMETQVKHLVRLVDDLMEVSRITRGKIQLRKERIDLAAVVASSVRSAQPAASAKSQQLSVDLQCGPLWLDGDPVRLTQVVFNLVNNATKYTAERGSISVELRKVDGEAVLKVTDNGIGIPRQMLHTIFDMFSQVDQSLTREHGGLGIGLTLVKNFIELHDGTVRAHSDGLGTGSRFEVRLPLPDLPPGEASTGASAAAAAVPTRRVLVVDDTRAAAFVIARLLEKMEQVVEVAHDGETALQMARQSPPDIVISDVAMPGMDGYELARQLRAEPQLRRAILVALTGHGQEADRERALQAGFDYHIVKPVGVDELQSILASS